MPSITIQLVPIETVRSVDLATNEVVKTTTYQPISMTPDPTVERISMSKIRHDRELYTDQNESLQDQINDNNTSDAAKEDDWNYGLANGLVEPPPEE